MQPPLNPGRAKASGSRPAQSYRADSRSVQHQKI